MKKTRFMFLFFCLTTTLLANRTFAANINASSAVTANASYSEDATMMPMDIVQSPDSLEIRKIYELSPSIDPGRLPRGGFERGGVIYECTDILREVMIGNESKTTTTAETVESPKNDMNTVLSLLPQFKEFQDEEGFSGTLMLNVATVKSEASGYGNTSKPYSVTRTYPNLSDADSQYIPKTIEEGGKTLLLQDIQWQSDNNMNVDDYEITNRFTAIATYGGTKTSSYIKGYTITADYTGEVIRTGVTVIRYTVIFTGAETPVSSEQIPASESEIKSIWLPMLISILALTGAGGCVFITIKTRKETLPNEKNFDDDDTDPYADDAVGNSSIGRGDGERS
ncbi:MAG: cell wall protein [Peptococcaceae bacterium]|jgi:hypothetical protein|nr:cell wall protein [Peptococcaceae bacterium]